ncbi:hypothetical protein JCM8208_005563 [Rhodotorula glutinis]
MPRHYDGPFRAMGPPDQVEYQVYVLAEFHKRASLNSSPLDGPDDYRRHGLARLFELARELQDRQPVELGRTPHNYVMNEQKRDFVDKVLQSLRSDTFPVGSLSSLWEVPKPAGDSWMWYKDQCRFAPGRDPGLTTVDITVDHGLNDLFDAFKREHSHQYLGIKTSERMVDSDNSDDSGDSGDSDDPGDSDDEEDEDPVEENALGTSFTTSRSTSPLDEQGAVFEGSCDFGGDDFGGGFDLGEEVGAMGERSPLGAPPWQLVSALEERERERDLGIGTSAQGATRAAAGRASTLDGPSVGRGSAHGEGRGGDGDGWRSTSRRGDDGDGASDGRASTDGEGPSRSGDGRWSKKRRGNDGVVVPARRADKAHNAAPLKALRIDERDVVDSLRLANARPARRRQRVAQRFTRTRTTFERRHAVVKPHNPFDEERLAEHFPEAVELADPDKADALPRRTYLLDKFWVHERDDPSTLVPLDRLLRVAGQPLPDVVVVGLVRPHGPVDKPRVAESKHRADRPAVVEAREVRLVARWDIRSLSFSVDGGPRLVSRIADYRLVTPRARSAVGKGKRRVAPLPRRRRPDSPSPLSVLPESYEPHVGVFRHLLNIYVFARTHAIRGSYVLSNDLGEDDDVESREASRVVDGIRRRMKVDARAGKVAWQDKLPAFWRVPVDALLDNGNPCDPSTDLLVFRSLPDLPFVTPEIYKLVSPFFLPDTFRTENVDHVKHEMVLEKHQTSALIKKYYDVVQEDLETQDDPVESVGRPVVKTSPAFVNDRSAVDKVKTWESARVNGVTYLTGDVVVMSSSMDSDGLATMRNHLASDLDSASGSESDDEQLEQLEQDCVAEDDTSGKVWYAVVEYFFQSRNEDELRVHLSWFSISKPIPSIGLYGPCRALYKLDRCDSPFATAISGHVEQPDDFRWLKPGEPVPDEGFYCGSTYSVDTGSIQDVSQLEPASFDKCREYGLVECASCESQAVYIDTTKTPVKDSQVRDTKAVRGDGGVDELFFLDGTPYHRDDTVYVAFREDDMDVKPSNIALPRRTIQADAARTTWRLARLVDLDAPPTDGDDEVVKVQIEWIVRAHELKLSRTTDDAYLSSHEVLVTSETEVVDAVSLRGRFTLAFVDEDDPDLAKTVATLEQSAADSFWTRARASSTNAETPFLNDSGVVTGKARRKPLEKRDVKVCAVCEAASSVKAARRRQVLQVDDLLLSAGALYSGGGLLDLGLEQGCSLLRTRVAIEKHRPALECLQSNFLSSPHGINKSVSDVNESVYFGEDALGPKPGQLALLSGGSPCQGFSRLNRFKTLDDLRCAEPFVFLSSLAVFRPLYALYENVAAFESHALPYPVPGHERGSFFRLFVAVATSLRYQLRWTIVNAAGYGVPQSRSRMIVQLAASGMRLPEVPTPSHAVKEARARRDHRLIDERDKKLEFSTEDGAPHSAVSLFEALDDLPAFDIKGCFDANQGYIARPFGVEGKPSKAAEYGSIARTTFQQRCRTYMDPQGPAFSGGVTHHFCRSLSETVARRVLGVKIGGNHEDIQGKSFYPEPPPNVLSNPAKLDRWWRRCTPGMILSPLRTTLSYDGSSQGERLHYSQSRPLSMRELLRVMGVPDAYELNFPSNVGDVAFDEQLRLIGNGVPVPLAAAFGRALEDALAPEVEAYFAERTRGKGQGKGVERAGNVWEKRWREIGSEALCARSAARAGREGARARRDEVGDGWAATASASSASPSPLCSGSSDEVASLLLSSTAHGDRDETDRTSFESGADGVFSPRRRVKAEPRAIEVHGSDSEDSEDEVWVRDGQGGARKVEPEVIDLCDSTDSDSD